MMKNSQPETPTPLQPEQSEPSKVQPVPKMSRRGFGMALGALFAGLVTGPGRKADQQATQPPVEENNLPIPDNRQKIPLAELEQSKARLLALQEKMFENALTIYRDRRGSRLHLKETYKAFQSLLGEFTQLSQQFPDFPEYAVQVPKEVSVNIAIEDTKDVSRRTTYLSNYPDGFMTVEAENLELLRQAFTPGLITETSYDEKSPVSVSAEQQKFLETELPELLRVIECQLDFMPSVIVAKSVDLKSSKIRDFKILKTMFMNHYDFNQYPKSEYPISENNPVLPISQDREVFQRFSSGIKTTVGFEVEVANTFMPIKLDITIGLGAEQKVDQAGVIEAVTVPEISVSHLSGDIAGTGYNDLNPEARQKIKDFFWQVIEATPKK